MKMGRVALQITDCAPETADSPTTGAKRLLDLSLPFKPFAWTQAAPKQAELEQRTTVILNRERHGQVLLPQTRGKGQRSPRGGTRRLSPAEHVW